jgi:polyhydroxybutyrate depolymerase
MKSKHIAFGILVLAIIGIIFISGCTKKDSNKSGTKNIFGSGDYQLSVQVKNLKRDYLVHVPSSYDKNTPMPVIINFHGGGGDAQNQMKQSQMNSKSDKEGFIVVYPQGTGKIVAGHIFGTWNAGACCGYAKDNNIDDVGFISNMIEDIKEKFNIDEKKVYATGLSNGALMSYRLACELSEKIAAIAPVSAQDATISCSPTRAVPIIHFHGTADPAAFYNGGACGTRLGLPGWNCSSVVDTIIKWRDMEGCTNNQTVILKNGRATCISYGKCKNSEIVLCTIQDAGHTWPGGVSTLGEKAVGKVNYDISANDVMWEFFEKHVLP